ncbi:MAG: hypothetical protein ABSB54_18875 [Acidimicrobiales bacterium]
MTELRVVISDDIAKRLELEAAGRGTSPEDVAAEILRLHAPTESSAKLGFIAIGRARPGFSARAAEERLEAEGFA